MTDETYFARLESKLDALERDLSNRRKYAKGGPWTHDSMVKANDLDNRAREIQAKLKMRLDAASRGVDWELLKLELQNDWLLLINSFGHWTRRLDQKFREQDKIA